MLRCALDDYFRCQSNERTTLQLPRGAFDSLARPARAGLCPFKLGAGVSRKFSVIRPNEWPLAISFACLCLCVSGDPKKLGHLNSTFGATLTVRTHFTFGWLSSAP